MERQVVAGIAKEKSRISVIIACRNEEENIEACISSLSRIQYPSESFEVIFVDDHSTDDTPERIKSGISTFSNFSLIAAGTEGQGKKQALQAGIANAKHECIVTTDADCTVPTDWLSYFSLFFEDQKTQMVLGGVRIADNHSLFGRLQRMEFSSLIGFAASALGWGRAVLGNAANMGFRKNAFREVNGYEGNLHVASGDDEFLIRKIARRFPGGIVFMNFSESWITTKPMERVTDFFNQRLRWAGKWKYSTDLLTRLIAVFILLVQLAFVFGLTQTFQRPGISTAVVGTKIIIEALYFFLIYRFQRTAFDLIAFFLLQIIYPLYGIVIGLRSLTGSYRWKDRNYK